MWEERSKYNTDPLDPDFVRHTEEIRGATGATTATGATSSVAREVGQAAYGAGGSSAGGGSSSNRDASGRATQSGLKN